MRTLLISALLFCSGMGAQSLYINAGGPSTIPVDPNTSPAFLADQNFSGGVAWDDPTEGSGIWETMRYGPQFSYDLHISNGFYTVKFDLLEPNKTAVNQRVFTIMANGIQSDPIDIFAMTEAVNAQTSVTLLAMVGNGHLRINFQASIGNALVNAIEVTPSTIFAGVQTVKVQLFTCDPPLSLTTCTNPVFQTGPPAAMQWFKCSSPCQGINLVHLKLADGTTQNLYAEQIEKSFQFNPAQWATASPGQ